MNSIYRSVIIRVCFGLSVETKKGCIVCLNSPRVNKECDVTSSN